MKKYCILFSMIIVLLINLTGCEGKQIEKEMVNTESEGTFTVIESPDSIFDQYSIIEVEEAPKMSEWAKAYYDYLA